MDIKQEWINSNIVNDANITPSQFYSADETIDEVKENFDIRRYHSAEGADVTVGGVSCRALVQYFTNPLNQIKYDRKLHVPIEISIDTGSLIEYEGSKWLVTGSVDNIQAYKSAGIVKCNNTLNLYKNHILYEIPIIIDSNIRLYDMGVTDNKYLTQIKGERVGLVPNNANTSLIEINDKYKIGKWNYEIMGLDDIIMPGLFILDLRLVLEQAPTPSYTLNILNGDNLLLTLGETLQLDVQVLDGTTIISPTPSIIYTSSNTLIATVSATGLITSLIEGDVIISAKLSSDLTVLDTLNLTIQEVVADNYFVDVYGDSSIVLSDTKTINAKVYNNGVEDITKGVNWTVTNEDGSVLEYLSIDSQDSNSITLTATSNSIYKNKNVVIKGTFTEDALVFDEHIIKIMSLF